ncbi:MAG: hypothetical protein U1F43_30330 [Myxococcota bacterium]
MRLSRARRAALVVGLVVPMGCAGATADVQHRDVTVDSMRAPVSALVEGPASADRIVVALRGGGVRTFDRARIAKVGGDVVVEADGKPTWRSQSDLIETFELREPRFDMQRTHAHADDAGPTMLFFVAAGLGMLVATAAVFSEL